MNTYIKRIYIYSNNTNTNKYNASNKSPFVDNVEISLDFFDSFKVREQF